MATAFPRATYRLQVNRFFTLSQAASLLDYFAALGVSHLYLSPVFTAHPGSLHGYDVVDPTSVNPEIGGERVFARLVEKSKKRGIGLILDIGRNGRGYRRASPCGILAGTRRVFHREDYVNGAENSGCRQKTAQQYQGRSIWG